MHQQQQPKEPQQQQPPRPHPSFGSDLHGTDFRQAADPSSVSGPYGSRCAGGGVDGSYGGQQPHTGYAPSFGPGGSQDTQSRGLYANGSYLGPDNPQSAAPTFVCDSRNWDIRN